MGRHGENVRKRSDGRWEARYMAYDEDKGGKIYRSVYGHSYEEVKLKRVAAIKNDVGLPGRKDTQKPEADRTLDNIPFGTVAEKWLTIIRAEQKPSTCEKYSLIYHNYLEEVLGSSAIKWITEKYIRERLVSCEAASNSLKKSIYCVLNGILRYASELYQIVLPNMKSSPSGICRTTAEAFIKSEQAKLLAALCQKMDLFKMAVMLCLFTGLRLGELCALKWKDIDFISKTLTIKRTVQRLYVENGSTKTALVETTPKSIHSRREIPLQNTIVTLLLRYQNGNEYVFGGNKPLDPRTMQNHYKKIMKEAGVPFQNFHTLRHTYATNCIEGGVDVKSLSEMLGHSNVKITLNYYVHPSMDTKRMYADSLCKFYDRINGQILGSTG